MKEICKIGMKLAVLLAPFFIVCPVLMRCFPMRFFDGEYAWYAQNKEYASGQGDYARVLIMGDSMAKAAYLPEELGADTYNFALGGGVAG